MACTPLLHEDPPPCRPGRAMTRCECSGLTFEDAARQMQTFGRTLEELKRTTGCGGTCTACIPDLQRYLAGLAR
jgi:bacterioferritin-associated ferredoxin